MSGDENLWYVKTPDGDVHRVTLDQLDEAFQAGRIDENVMVLGGGSTKWAKLGDLAGLDEPAAPPPASAAVPMSMPSSLRPVSMDLSLDLDDENVFRKKSPKRGIVIGVVVGIVAVFGGIFALSHGHADDSSAPVAAAAHPAVDPIPASSPAPPLPTTTATPPADTSNAAKLSDEQKAKLALADKELEQKSKARKKNRAAAASGGGSHSAKYKSFGFTTGGSKFDPLNANP
jgi:flagellar basal body-associated protein FliL